MKKLLTLAIAASLISCTKTQLSVTPPPDIDINPIKIEQDVMLRFENPILRVDKNATTTLTLEGKIGVLLNMNITAAVEEKTIEVYILERTENGNNIFLITEFKTKLNEMQNIYSKKNFSEIGITPNKQNKYYLLLK